MQIWDAGVDWLTMTFAPGHKDYVRTLHGLRAEMALTKTEANPILPACHDRYIGLKQGKLMVGEREDGMIVRVSGSRARLIVQMFKENNIDGKPTRIDFQGTAKTTADVPTYMQRICGKVEAATASENGKRARNSGVYKNRGRSCGMVVGSRSSENYLRFYDKTLEQGGRCEPGLIRAEVELKGKRARQAWNMIRSSASPYYLSCSVVKGEFMAVGVDFDWLATGEKAEFPSSYEPTSVERKMDWFRKNVRPSVQACVEVLGREAVLEALGLDIT